MTAKLLAQFDRNYLIFLLATALIGIGQSVDGAAITNYFRDCLGMSILERSGLETPRELPGLLVVVIIGLMTSLGDVRIAAVANLLAGIGMFLLGVIPYEYKFVVMTMFVYSLGTHIYLPTSNSIGMSFATAKDMGRKLGRINSVSTATLVVSSAILWVLFHFCHISFTATFTIGAIAFMLAAVCLLFVKPTQVAKTGKRFIFRKEYGLYYWLSILFGARKQVFLTFGPWVLVDVFQQKVTTMTLLFFIISVTGIFLKPWLGKIIDERGEKYILTREAFLFFFICLGYAFATDLFSPTLALSVICLCYIIDQSLSSVSMARATYMKKLARTPDEVSPSLSLGTSLDHISTMVLPLIGGLVWYNSGPNGYKYVFLGGAVIAMLNFISAQFINVEKQKHVTVSVDRVATEER
ncbi:MAG: major facilitator superfamily 1 [Firmicutes bacterium]|nr:major facilitator superfamily 1 [Bacillota bacterium]